MCSTSHAPEVISLSQFKSALRAECTSHSFADAVLDFEVRGELILSKSEFHRVQQASRTAVPFKTARNLVAGLLHRLDSNQLDCSPQVSLRAYSLHFVSSRFYIYIIYRIVIFFSFNFFKFFIYTALKKAR